MDINWEEYIYRGFDESLEELLNEFEFKSIIRELGFKEQKKVLKINTLPDIDDLSSKGTYELLKPKDLEKFSIF
ncbi:hypothetical protein [Marinitoga lauensis]|uniref:hypothetical protein n=1 Tax=Marinitoga lauensis TaxID=2201189 RepID=UPI00197F33B0|nr:hypothetical protein [Marinitoga lauensis]